MKIKTVESTSSWPFKVPIFILGIYFLIILPCTQIFFRTKPGLYEYLDTLFFAVIVLFVLFRTNFAELGFSTKHLNQHLFLGAITGGTLLISFPLMEIGLEATSLKHHDLFKEKPQSDISYNFNFLLKNASIVLLIPLIEQIFFTGFILQALLKKINPVLAVYAISLIYVFAEFKLTLAAFGLGMGASFLFMLTGTLYASILFHMSCALGGILLENIYPRMITILSFLL